MRIKATKLREKHFIISSPDLKQKGDLELQWQTPLGSARNVTAVAAIVPWEVQFVHKQKLFYWAGSLALEHVIQRGCGIFSHRGFQEPASQGHHWFNPVLAVVQLWLGGWATDLQKSLQTNDSKSCKAHPVHIVSSSFRKLTETQPYSQRLEIFSDFSLTLKPSYLKLITYNWYSDVWLSLWYQLNKRKIF